MQYSTRKNQELFDEHQFHFKKKFGQNFIMDENLIDAIIRRVAIKDDSLVIEIGPGAGALTYKLSKVAKQVLAYEIDKSLKPILNEHLKECDNVRILFQDFLISDVMSDLKKYHYQSLLVVANLPYYITTPILMKLLKDDIPVNGIIVMVQKEVGDRFRAKPGTKDYNSLSILFQYYYDVEKVMDVSRHIFVPKPNVDSIILKFTKKDTLQFVKDKTLFETFVRDAFRQKRKTIKNNLSKYDLVRIEQVLHEYGFDLSARAEQLSIDIFIDMANKLAL